MRPLTPDPDHTWRRIDSDLRQRVPADMYEMWLAPLRLVGIEGGQVIVEAPPALRAWITQRFARVLHASAMAVLGPDAVVRVRAAGEDQDGSAAGRRPTAATTTDDDQRTITVRARYIVPQRR